MMLVLYLCLRIVKKNIALEHRKNTIYKNKALINIDYVLLIQIHNSILNIEMNSGSSKINQLHFYNTTFKGGIGPIINGFGINISLWKNKMIGGPETRMKDPKFLELEKTQLTIEKCSFSGGKSKTNEKKINSFALISPVIFLDTEFKNMRYEGSSGSGIILENHFRNFETKFVECRITNDEINATCLNGGFYYQMVGNNYTCFENCIFINLSARNYGGALLLNNNTNIMNCEFDTCYAKEGSSIYIYSESSKINITSIIFKNMIESNDIMSIDGLNQEIFILFNFTFTDNGDQTRGILGVSINNIDKLILKQCKVLITSSINILSPVYHDTDIELKMDDCKFISKSTGRFKSMNYILSKAEYDNCEFEGLTNMLTISTNESFAISNSTFNAIAKDGEMINFDSLDMMTFMNCTFRDISCNSIHGGLGLVSENGTGFQFFNCVFDNVGSYDVLGGGILNISLNIMLCNFQNCIFNECYCQMQGGCIYLSDIYIPVLQNTTLYVINCTFNECHTTIGAESGNDGGSIFFVCNSQYALCDILKCTFNKPGKSFEYLDGGDFSLAYIMTEHLIFSQNIINDVIVIALMFGTTRDYFLYPYVIDSCVFTNFEADSSFFAFTDIIEFSFNNCTFKNFLNHLYTGVGLGFIAISAHNFAIKFENCIFKNITSENTSAIFDTFVEGRGDFDFDIGVINCTFTDCYSKDFGCFACRDYWFKFVDSTFTNCQTNGSGAAISCPFNPNSVDIINCVFDKNRAEEYGGAIYFNNKNFNLENLVANENLAKKGGGFIFLKQSVACLLISTLGMIMTRHTVV